MKLPEHEYKCFSPPITESNSIQFNENLFNRTGSIKGNLFKNTSKNTKFNSTIEDPYLKYQNKYFNMKNKGNTQDNFYTSQQRQKILNSDLYLNNINNYNTERERNLENNNIIEGNKENDKKLYSITEKNEIGYINTNNENIPSQSKLISEKLH